MVRIDELYSKDDKRYEKEQQLFREYEQNIQKELFEIMEQLSHYKKELLNIRADCSSFRGIEPFQDYFDEINNSMSCVGDAVKIIFSLLNHHTDIKQQEYKFY